MKDILKQYGAMFAGILAPIAFVIVFILAMKALEFVGNL